MDKKIIKYMAKKAEEVEDRVLRFVGSNEEIDRDGDIIKASGWKLANYKKNPVIMVNHKRTELPVAKAKKVWVEDKKLMFDVEFPEPDVYPYADTIYKLYKGGYMNATSVGFMPDMEKVKFGERKGDPRMIINGQELLELSLVSIPANPTALLTSKGMKDAIEEKCIDQLEFNDFEQWLKNYFTEEKIEKDSKTEEKANEEETEAIENTATINKCSGCGNIITLCPTCHEKAVKEQEQKDKENFFKMLYESIMK